MEKETKASRYGASRMKQMLLSIKKYHVWVEYSLSHSPLIFVLSAVILYELLAHLSTRSHTPLSIYSSKKTEKHTVQKPA